VGGGGGGKVVDFLFLFTFGGACNENRPTILPARGEVFFFKMRFKKKKTSAYDKINRKKIATCS
jgi:hypothetical protein